MTRDDFLPVTPEDVRRRGWDAPDFVYVCGDAYVDHPSFGHAIIGRVLEDAGYKVAMLCLPPHQDATAFRRFGKPRLGFLVSAGVIDSMVNHIYAAKKPRSEEMCTRPAAKRVCARTGDHRLLQPHPAGLFRTYPY
jgi:hypothetical protein